MEGASQQTIFFLRLILPRSSGKKDVTCWDLEQNLKGCSASGKSFTAEQIIQQTLANKKQQQPSHNLDSLPVRTKEESLYSYHTPQICYGR